MERSGTIAFGHAQRVETLLIDDLDGSAAHETVKFGLDGASYKIDLSSDNAVKLREALDPWAERARRVGRRGRPAKRIDLGPPTQVVRAWAKANGHKLADTGRVPAAIRDAYDKAHATI